MDKLAPRPVKIDAVGTWDPGAEGVTELNMMRPKRTSMAAWKRADLHMHTSFSGWRSLRLIDAQDCYVPPDRAYGVARQRGMDFVCFTDHDTIDGALDFLGRYPDEEPRVIVGEEVETRFPNSAQWIHINVFGIDERLHDDITRLRCNCFELIAELRRRKVLFTLNHPFQSFRSSRAAERHLAEILPLFPIIEVANSASPQCHRAILETMLQVGGLSHIARVGGSDAHTTSRIASVYTLAPAGTKTEFLESIRRGNCSIDGSSQGLSALLRDVYLIIGQYHRRLYFEPHPLGRSRKLVNLVSSGMLLPATLLGVPALVTLGKYVRQEWIARTGPWGRHELRRSAQPLPLSERSGENRPL
jgi:predicted metal-dependent phosphoesterase TrpH